jgi:peptide-methionine (S)-S-oxide reductase
MKKTESQKHLETAILAAGCFWGVEEAFRTLPGVVATEVGYTGGDVDEPTYEQVCDGNTGHAEAVKITFDPKELPYEQILEVFWESHDPTTMNRQGPDVGEQYRSAIFYLTPEQKELAEWSKQAAQNRFSKKIVTHIEKAREWWKAEGYHQQYFLKRGGGTCHI